MIRARSGNFVPDTRSNGRRFDGWEAEERPLRSGRPIVSGDRCLSLPGMKQASRARERRMDEAMSDSYGPGRSIACIRIPSFCWQVEAARRPSFRDHGPVLITGAATDLPENASAPTRQRRSPGNPSERIVLDHSPKLDGVAPGMPLSEAVSRHKNAILVEADLPNYISVFEDLLERLEALAPDV